MIFRFYVRNAIHGPFLSFHFHIFPFLSNMNGSLLFSILSVLVPLTGAVPGHGHSHAHIHRDFHDNVQRDHVHTHEHVHRDVLDLQPAVEARVVPPSGCGRRPKSNGTGKGKPELSSGIASNLGGVFATSTTDDAAASSSSTSSISEVSSPTIVEPMIPVTTAVPSSSSSSSSSSPPKAVETQNNVAQAAVASISASVLESFQHSYTLATRTSAVQVTTSTSEAATVTAVTGSGSGSGSGGASTGDADNLTVVVRNMMADALTTSHAMNADLPVNVQAITATLTDGTMSAGATATMIYPSGWAGNMGAAKVASSEDEVVDLADASLIEGSFVVQMGDAPVNDMDVSYV